MAWGKAGSTTLGSAGDDMDITSMTANKFNQILVHKLYSTDARIRETFENNSNSVYAKRQSYRGGADSTNVSQAYIEINLDGQGDELHIQYVCSISAEEKLLIGFGVTNSTAGAGTFPDRLEYVAKFVPSPDSDITRIDMNNYGTGDFATDSNVSVLGSEITPAAAVPGLGANVQVGSRYEETDTRKMYNLVGADTPTYEDDFSSDNWTDNDSTNIGVSGGALTWSMKRDNTNDASVRDLTSTSDNWVLRFKVTQGSSIGSTGAGNGFFFGISDSDQSVAQNGNQDFVGMAYYYDNQSEYNAMDCDGASLPHLYQGDAGQNFNITANDVFYFEIIKNGSSYTVEGFTNSDYSTGSLGQISGTTTATGLRYLKIMNELSNGSISTSTSPFNGTIDDVEFYNGITSISTSNTWQEIGA